jgi:hypothetical protein
MSESLAHSRGALVSAVLAGSWRPQSIEAKISQSQLDEVTPLLHESGAAALGWHRISRTDLRSSPSGDLLHQIYRLQTLQAAINEIKIRKVFSRLRSAGIEPIIFKGWSIARLYPEQGSRPYGDIDILVRPEDREAVKELLNEPEMRDCWVDLHDRLSELNDRKIDDLFERSQLVSLGDEQIRILAPEDHFGLLAIHLLRHGAWRPLWLCDIGIALDSLPEKFDWDLCLGKSKLRRNWITSAIGLAQALLDAQINEPAIAEQAKQIPVWLVRNVLKQWAAPSASNQEPNNHRAPIASYLRDPRGVLGDLRRRWPNPILATISINGKLNRLPRLPYQLGNCLNRTAKLVWQFPSRLSEKSDLQ